MQKNVCTRPHKNVPSPLFLYVFFAFFSIWLFHLKCISHGRRGTSNIKMFHTGWKLKSTIHLSFGTIKRSNLGPQLLAFPCVSFATLFGSETEKVPLAGVFQPIFRIFVSNLAMNSKVSIDFGFDVVVRCICCCKPGHF